MTADPSGERETIERFIAIQTRGKTDLPKEEVLALLVKRRNRLHFMAAINVFAVLFFGYSILSGISRLPQWSLVIIGCTFLFNLFVIYRQVQWAGKALVWKQPQPG